MWTRDCVTTTDTPTITGLSGNTSLGVCEMWCLSGLQLLMMLFLVFSAAEVALLSFVDPKDCLWDLLRPQCVRV